MYLPFITVYYRVFGFVETRYRGTWPGLEAGFPWHKRHIIQLQDPTQPRDNVFGQQNQINGNKR